MVALLSLIDTIVVPVITATILAAVLRRWSRAGAAHPAGGGPGIVFVACYPRRAVGCW